MTRLKTTLAVFLLSSTVSVGTMYIVGWRSVLGIIGASIGSGLTVAFVTRRRD